MNRPAFAALAVLVLLVPAASVAAPAPRARLDPALGPFLEADAERIGVIVRFVDAPTAADAAAMRDAGFLPGMVRYDVVPAIYAEGGADAVRAIQRDPRVAYVSYDSVLPWTLDRAAKAGRAEPAWDATWQALDGVHTGGITGRGVRVAVVDSGVDATHPDLLWAPIAQAAGLQATTAANFKVLGRDSVGLTGLFLDDELVEANMLAVDMADTDTTGGHGTHVAGSVAGNGFSSGGKYRGAAPQAQLVGYGAGETLLVHLGLAAFDHIHRHHEELGIRVVTNSWGGAGDWDPESPVTLAAQRLVNEDGLVVLFAAGNDGGDGSSIQTSVWANIPEVISVANYYDRRGWLDDSSSRGLASLERTWPDVAAPGTQIISTQATGRPVTWVCTGQDAVIDELLSDGSEPTVLSVPSPVVVETEVQGETILVGGYASCTGTSMATPFVAGVVALLLEANPALGVEDVRAILRETANLPNGRAYATDGFAIGKGVVDAAEAVAVALRMKDGATLEQALATAYVDYSASPAAMNFALPRRLVVDATSVAGTTLSVGGTLFGGPLTDATVPLQPAGSQPPASALLTIFHPTPAGSFNPCALTLNGCVVGGETVELVARGLTAQRPDVPTVGPATETRHVVYRDGVAAFTLDADVVPDGAGWQSAVDWTAPAAAPQGAYAFAGEILTPQGWEEFGRIAFTYVPLVDVPSTAASVALPAALLGASEVVFLEDFEDGAGDWEVRQEGFGPGLLTEWSLIDADSQLSWAGSHGGSNFWWAGFWPGTPENSGLYYTDMADTSLVSPVIDLTSASDASLSYWRAGFSELDFDFLRVLVETDAGLTVVDEVSGDILNGGEASGSWEESVVSLDAFIGQAVRLHFRFTSDDATVGWNLAGWSVDDVTVTATLGAGPEPVVNGVFTVDRDLGVGGLDATFAWNGSGNVPITGYVLDFGDGSPVHTSTGAGAVTHAYAPGQYVATLTVDGAGASDTVTLALDVAPTGVVQVRVADRPWVDAGAATGLVDAPFAADLDVTGLTGPQRVEVRHYDADGRLVRTSTLVTL